jgi:hypothetical protein
MQHEYKQCAGKGCENEGKIVLVVQYLKRTGCFCRSCAEDLLRLGLAVRHEDASSCAVQDRRLPQRSIRGRFS